MNDGPGRDPARRFASIVLVGGALVHHDRRFTYSVPDGMAVEAGSLVRAPVRGKRQLGVVVDLLDKADVERTAPLAAVVGPGLPADVLALALWTGERTLSTEGEALAAALPERVAAEEKAGAPDPSAHPSPPDLAGVQRLRGGAALVSALTGGAAKGFVVRLRPDRPRGALVAAIAALTASQGRGVIVTLPETAVRSEVADALGDALGEQVAWLGSDRSDRDRYRDWLRLRRGDKLVAVGGRAAVFAPVPSLGAVVVDDEAHATYKEGRAPRFHVRAVAAQRARAAGASVVLIGTPPSIEALAATATGSYALVAAARNEEREGRPPVIVVDRSKEGSSLTPAPATMTMAVRALAAGGRVAFLVHRAGEELSAIADRVGRVCKREATVLGAGRAASVEALSDARLIVATPVLAKDIVVVGVDLLAIVDADAALSHAGFRGPEETFSTWWRAARWAAGGRIVIETGDPSHPAVRALTRWEPDVLWQADAARRRELGYPPFASLARIDTPADRADDVAEQVRAATLDVLGPVEHEGHWVVVARAARRADLLEKLKPLVRRWRAAEEPMRVDVDPWEVLVPRWRS